MQYKEQNIEKYRAEIDDIDKHIICYLNKRKEISEKLILEKQYFGQDVYDPDREEEIINNLFHDQNNKLSLDIIRRIYTAIFFSSKSDFVNKIK